MHQSTTEVVAVTVEDTSVNELKKQAQNRMKKLMPLVDSFQRSTHELSPFQLMHQLQLDPMNVLVIDCRDEQLYQESHIITSINIPPLMYSSSAKTIEQSFTSYEDRIFFRQREFVNVVVLYSDSIEESILPDAQSHTQLLYHALKDEGLAKSVLFLQGGYPKFYSMFPLFCECFWPNGRRTVDEDDEYAINSSTISTELEQEELLELSTVDTEDEQVIILNTTTVRSETCSFAHTMTKSDRVRLAHSRLFSSFSSKLTCETPSELLPFLYLGSAQNAYNMDQLQNFNIKCIVNAAVEVENFYPDHFEYFKCDLMDDEHADASFYFEETYQFIERARKSRRKILVQCFMGMSRSASIAIAYLMRAKKWNMKKAYNFVKKQRPIISINAVFMYQLMHFEFTLFGKSSFPSNILRKALKEVSHVSSNNNHEEIPQQDIEKVR